MLTKVFITECLKLRHSKLTLAILILPIIACIMGSFNYLQNIDILTHAWYSLWTQICLFYTYFFFPSLIGIYCAYICRLEHTRNNWNAVLTTPIPYSFIFIGKLLVISCLNLITQLFICILYLLSGYLLGLEGSIPSQFFLWIVLSFISSVSVSSFLLCSALIIRSFAIPIGIGIAGGIGGVIMLSKGYSLYFPFSLICASMNTLTPEVPLTSDFCIQLILSSLLFTIIFSIVGINYLKNKCGKKS